MNINNLQIQNKGLHIYDGRYPTSYREVMIGNKIYRVTSVYKGDINLKDALEDLAVRRVLRDALAETGRL